MDRLIDYLMEIFEDLEVLSYDDGIIDFEGFLDDLIFCGVCFYDDREGSIVVLGFLEDGACIFIE
jgi:hypothetical protein